ncbi:hypothetical protein DL991_40960 [Amycolatopsis sp. WAC 01375]|uniref:hypothetical protein n=1 Tax=Amycolatopsis sp. WAC 01375 TaxID=2203194 RepID=UPI000F7A0C08|nr:hypothetical protein [Amycolatopsis sp. WAC 01375]RSM68948.1 hypothetical protein DL991_40960 [Amycolatopsis sp. WAC 01375]
MTRIPVFGRSRSRATGNNGPSALEQADAEIRLADADLERSIRARRAELDLVERETQVTRLRTEQQKHLKRRAGLLRVAVRRRRRQLKRRARLVARAEVRARFEAALAGRLVAILVALAVATAWHGQYRFLREAMELGVLFAAAGATALELFGLSMFGIARDLGKFRHRALRVRMFGWAVIAFSAYSNLEHNGVVLAAMSVAGPVAWEMHEWSQQRIQLHQEGKLVSRPVRPRFPIDQVVLFPVWTLRAYRQAVRDRIENVDQALAAADRGRLPHDTVGRLAGVRWRRVVRRSIAQHRRLMEAPNRPESVSIDRVGRRLESVVNDLERLSQQLQQVPRWGVDSLADKTGSGGRPRSTWLRRRRRSAGTASPAAALIDETRKLDDGSIDRPGKGSASTPVCVSDEPIDHEQEPPRHPAAPLSVDRSASAVSEAGAPPRAAARRAPMPDPGSESRPIATRSDRSAHDTDRSGSDDRSGSSIAAGRSIRSIQELHDEARQLARQWGWTSAAHVTAEALRTGLRISPKRARDLRALLREDFDQGWLPTAGEWAGLHVDADHDSQQP